MCVEEKRQGSESDLGLGAIKFQIDLKETIMFLSISRVIVHWRIYAEMVVFPQEAN